MYCAGSSFKDYKKAWNSRAKPALHIIGDVVLE